jgi:nickel-dependent lactate racemase
VQIRIPYGHTTLTAFLPDEIQVDHLEPAQQAAATDPLEAVNLALDRPLGEVQISDFGRAKSVAIAINDKTRPVPHQYLLPPLLERLEAAGIAPEAIQLVIAVGLHGPMPAGEFSAILPEAVLKRYRVLSHDAKDANNLVYLGETARRTPVWVNKTFAQADVRIVVGNIEPHQFVGFSGGVKSAVIGLGGAETIQHNHAMLTDPACRVGDYETNPARQDVEEIGTKIGVHFALNAILNQEKQIVYALAGSPLAVMQAGIPLSRQVCQLQVPWRYDLLIVSAGGHPKDINLYQAQKGLAHAALVARPGGTIILAAACPEGTGSQSYEDWMKGMTSFEQVLERFKQEGFRIGPHKAFQIARDAANIRLVFISEMEPGKARSLLLPPGESLQKAVDQALAGLPKGSRIGILPHASSTIPLITGES